VLTFAKLIILLIIIATALAISLHKLIA